MEVYATEEQQVEAIKQWFKKYGNLLSWILIIGLGLYSAIQYWQHHQKVVKTKASDEYGALLQAIEAKDNTTVEHTANLLVKDYESSVYAIFANFFLVDDYVKNKYWEQAENKLKWIIEHASQPQLVALAQWRLMKAYAAQGKESEAIAVYDQRKSDTYVSLMAELKGDILLKKGDKAQAMKAYEFAYSAAPEEGMHGPLLKMKMDELGIATPKEAVKS